VPTDLMRQGILTELTGNMIATNSVRAGRLRECGNQGDSRRRA